jgi:hypothetical protein
VGAQVSVGDRAPLVIIFAGHTMDVHATSNVNASGSTVVVAGKTAASALCSTTLAVATASTAEKCAPASIPSYRLCSVVKKSPMIANEFVAVSVISHHFISIIRTTVSLYS